MSHLIMESFFDSAECEELKAWMKSSSPPQETESINFPAGQAEFDTKETKFSEANEEHRYQSMELLTAESTGSSSIVFQKGSFDKAGKNATQLKNINYLRKHAFNTCPPFFKEFISMIHRTDACFGYFVVKSLISYPGGTQQWYHCDDAKDTETAIISRDDVTYSIIIALEPDSNETLLYGADYNPNDKHLSKGHRRLSNEKEFILHQGDFIMFRGDYPHGGAGYNQENWRLHIAITPSKDRYGGSVVGWLDKQPQHLIDLKLDT